MTNLHFDTIALTGGYNPADHHNASAVPIYQTAAYTYNSAEHAANLFELKEFGNIYSRIMNPTCDVLEKRIAMLEGGAAALAVSSGQSAQFLAIHTLAEAGENIVASAQLYGGTYSQFKNTFKKMGIEVRLFDIGEPEKIKTLADEKTKAVYIESIGNPGLQVPDFQKIADIAHDIGVPFIVDNTFGSPALLKPIQHGADIVVHSATKYLGGHGTSIGGLIIDAGTFDWANGRFPSFTEPSDAYHGTRFNDIFGKNGPFGNITFIIKARLEGLRDLGTTMSAFNAFLFLQGIETLSLRMERHSKNALALAEFLESHPAVASVNYPGLKSSPDFDLAKKYFPNGCGGMLSFVVKGGKSAGQHFVETVKVALHETNLGDVRTIVNHPASTTHQQLSEEEQIRCGISPGMVRASVGIEHIDDLIADFTQAL